MKSLTSLFFYFISFFILLFSFFISYAQNPLTNREIYDFEVGDVFHTKREASIVFNSGDFWYKKEVISKKISLDSIFYVFKVDEFTPPVSINEPWWRHKNYNESQIVVNLNSQPHYADSTIIDSSLFNGRPVTYSDGLAFKYVKGCGGWYGTLTNPPGYEIIELLYFKKGSEEWGNKLYLGEEKFEQNKNVRVFPNPTNGFVTLQSDKYIGNMELVVRNHFGAEISRTKLVFNKYHELQLDGSPGIYFIELRGESFREMRKVIKE